MSNKRLKKMAKKEFEKILKKEWNPQQIDDTTLPSWIKNIPREKLFAAFGSGSLDKPNPEIDNNKTIKNQVGGMDIYRYAEKKDGVELNKDWYRFLLDPNDADLLIVVGPIKDKEHWIDDIPSRLQFANVIKLED